MTWPQYLRAECTVSHVVRLTSPQAEILLLLLLRKPNPVTLGELIEWLHPEPECEPASPEHAVRRMLTRVRALVGEQEIAVHSKHGFRIADMANSAP